MSIYPFIELFFDRSSWNYNFLSYLFLQFSVGSAQMEYSGIQYTYRALSTCMGITHWPNKQDTLWAKDYASLAELRSKLWQGSNSHSLPDPQLQEWHSLPLWRK